MTYTNWGAASLCLQLRERLFLMETKKKWTREKRKRKNGFRIICDFVLAVEGEASLDLGTYYKCIQKIWMIFQPIRYVDFGAIERDTLYQAVSAGWPRSCCIMWHSSRVRGQSCKTFCADISAQSCCTFRPGLSSGNLFHLLPVSCAQGSQLSWWCVWGLLFSLGFEGKLKCLRFYCFLAF